MGNPWARDFLLVPPLYAVNGVAYTDWLAGLDVCHNVNRVMS